MERSRTYCIVCATYIKEILQCSHQCRQGYEAVNMPPTQLAIDNYANSIREICEILAAYLIAKKQRHL